LRHNWAIVNTSLYTAAAILPLVFAIVVAIAVWRSASHQRTKRDLHEGLTSPDPARRRVTLERVDEDQLARYAPMFVRLLESESDPEVLDALAAAVARSRWEPTDNGNLVELRRWVAGRHAHLPLDDAAPFGPRRAGAADVGVGDEDAASTGPDDAAADTGPTDGAGDGAADARAVAGPAVADRGHLASTSTSATTLVEPTTEELAELVPNVREVLGDELERLELVSIDGRVLATWSAPESPDLN
jgi:hypothetical protein